MQNVRLRGIVENAYLYLRSCFLHGPFSRLIEWYYNRYITDNINYLLNFTELC